MNKLVFAAITLISLFVSARAEARNQAHQKAPTTVERTITR